MNQKELKELIEFLVEKDIAEFELERGDVKVRMKRKQEAPPPAQYGAAAPAGASFAQPPAPAPVRPAEAASAPAGIEAGAEARDEAGLHLLRSPIVGTFYESPSPGAAAFVKPGDHVSAGQVVCIIEAMKLMNEIEADATGEIVKRHVANAQPVEYGQPLFAIRATG
jgi:acetyl-CoA carboxylase biotin carboxyl carrier protein